jgi:hypothetical protein
MMMGTEIQIQVADSSFLKPLRWMMRKAVVVAKKILPRRLRMGATLSPL